MDTCVYNVISLWTSNTDTLTSKDTQSSSPGRTISSHAHPNHGHIHPKSWTHTHPNHAHIHPKSWTHTPQVMDTHSSSHAHPSHGHMHPKSWTHTLQVMDTQYQGMHTHKSWTHTYTPSHGYTKNHGHTPRSGGKKIHNDEDRQNTYGLPQIMDAYTPRHGHTHTHHGQHPDTHAHKNKKHGQQTHAQNAVTHTITTAVHM